MKYRGIGILSAAVTLACIFAGCRSEEPVRPPVPPITSRMNERAVMFGTALAGVPQLGTVIDRDTVDFYTGTGRPAELAERLNRLKINRLYIVVSSKWELHESFDYSQALADLIYAAASRGVTTELLLRQSDFQGSRMGGAILRKLFFGSKLTDAAEPVRLFNERLPAGAKISGVTVECEIHKRIKANPNLPPDSIYAWGPESFGIGHDNDMLMRRLLEELREFRTALNPEFQLTVMVPAAYHGYAAGGKLSCGSITDFAALCDRTIVLGAGNKPSEFAESMMPSFAALADKPGSALMGIVQSGHSSESISSLRRRDWGDFEKIMKYLLDQGRQQPAFGGMVVMPWYGFELLWER